MSLPATLEDVTADWIAARLRGAGTIDGDLAEVRVERIGADRGFSGVVGRVTWRDARDRGGTLVVKIPRAAGPDWERAAREVQFYVEVAGTAGLRLPAVVAAGAEPGLERVILVLEDVSGRPGDAGTGAGVDDLAAVLVEIAGLHGRWWCDARLDADELDWLPRWGEGVRDDPRPHRRRVERYRRRLPMFLDAHGRPEAPGAMALLERLLDELEPHLVQAAALPRTIIHADLHLDNVIFPDDAGAPPCVIDWQSVSRGPAIYDVTRWILGGLHGRATHADAPPLLRVWRDAALAAGGDVPGAEVLAAQVASMAQVAVAGFVMGYAGRPPHAITPREAAMVQGDLGPDGLMALAVTLAD